jgi:transcriptional regulator
MYIPKIFKNEDLEDIKQFIKANGFGILVTQVENRPWAVHIPLLFDVNEQGKEVLTGHIAKANPQWRDFKNNEEVLAIFNGPHAYISSSWYDHENVPTWNYVAVHVYGKIRLIEGEELMAHLSKLVHKYEKGRPNPVSVETMSPGYADSQIKGLVAFEIEIASMEGKKKLSQNRDEKNLNLIVDQLQNQEDQVSKAIGQLMNELKKPN